MRAKISLAEKFSGAEKRKCRGNEPRQTVGFPKPRAQPSQAPISFAHEAADKFRILRNGACALARGLILRRFATQRAMPANAPRMERWLSG
ncbi:hypothetical protein K9U39_01465 [Rhodoblastus acidophilus]|uniref:Uncharacterized protein n=1 Tax=Candidatus Rhodoblastus alkanivorans TaxID=2954117 RepID=A0ABS9Z3S1_9HYPH|nr:hypothetical protein [Candidatus Rhodoblastus alkanivorans]MCI4680711.1 hypothetical protein [Candidatus Rhodoblastus alkanivorans]MCI4682318.1 hypothetical protein [Candidatus Rhodoblastus alkanivorans]MDI4639620.1 hypothetical protein [Rhodoblastus acidophilus]